MQGREEVPYFRTHPMSMERMAFFDKAIKANGGQTTSPYDQDFKFVQAKLSAFLRPIEQVLQTYPVSNHSDTAEYAHAIVKFRQKKFQEAIAIMDKLIEKNNQNPYFYQLKGQFLFESGNPAAAVVTYEKALELKPDSKETMLLYAESALELPNNKQHIQTIINTLNQLQIKQETPRVWELFAKAYYERGSEAESLYASAKYSLLIDNVETAKKQIQKALSLSPKEGLKLKLSDLENEIKEQKD